MTEPFELRCRRIYQEDERVKLNPGDSATVNRRQLRAMQDAVGRARSEGRITIAEANVELAQLAAVRAAMDQAGRPIGITLCPKDREFSLRRRPSQKQREKRKAEKKSRAAGRPAKKPKGRKKR